MKKMITQWFVIVLVAPISLVHANNQQPISNIEATISYLETLVTKGLSAQNCVELIDGTKDNPGLYSVAYNLTPSQFLPENENERKRLADEANSLLQRLFKLRRQISLKLSSFTEQGEQPQCAKSTRKILRVLRYAEDYLGEWALWEKSGVQPLPKTKDRNRQLFGEWITVMGPNEKTQQREFIKPQVNFTQPVLEGTAPHLLTYSPDFELQSGDILLSRGNQFSSAVIARIGDDDGQFSHLALLYIDPQGESIKDPVERKKHMWVIEAHLEGGVMIVPFEEYQKDGKVRAVVYRYKDATVAEQAAAGCFKEYGDIYEQTGNWLPYDFKMEMGRDYRSLLNTADKQMCAEVVSYCYAKATSGQVILPAYPSTFFELKKRTSGRQNSLGFLADLGIETDWTFAPADIEVDNTVELVAEWRDYSRMEDIRLLDATMTAVFSWMRDFEYDLDRSGRNWFSRVSGFLYNTPLRRFVREKVPPGMADDFVTTSIKMWGLSGNLIRSLETFDENQRKITGLPISYKQMIEHLEGQRQKDYQRWLKHVEKIKNDTPLAIKIDRQGLDFHHILHPPIN